MENGNGTRRLPTYEDAPFRPLLGANFRTARYYGAKSEVARTLNTSLQTITDCSASDLGLPDGGRWVFKKFLAKGKRGPTEEQASNGRQKGNHDERPLR
jgi:hypothetical protein